MAASNPITDKELEDVFQDDPEFGLKLLYTDFRDQIARYIKSKLWGLPAAIRSQEVKDVFQETMLALVPFVRDPNFDWREPLRIVFAIAENKAIDAVRKAQVPAKAGCGWSHRSNCEGSGRDEHRPGMEAAVESRMEGVLCRAA